MSNTRTNHSEWNEHSERRELARLLPPPPHPEPSPSHLAARRDVLLAEFGRPRPFSALTARWRSLVVVTAVATAAAITAAALAPDTTTSRSPSPPATAASVELLDRIARVAYAQPQPLAQDDQFTYLRTVSHSRSLTEAPDGSMARADLTTHTERWTSVDGTRTGLERRNGAETQLPYTTGSMGSRTYRLLSAMPTDPDALLKQIYADAGLNHGSGSASSTGADHEAFITIGDLLRDVVAPPQVSSALYRAAARIPGVVTVDDSVDATGRHGVAVARVNDGRRFEWIFDPATLGLLGTRTVLIRDGVWGNAGDEVDSTAVLAQCIVGALGEAAPAVAAESSH
ncbi:CU044_5270 family protein [Kitasatospora sp. NPDC058032]|uniref:CU044_5270 family protein n=1 Tax=Kitasatospora sp. NPDC058032 TaxID=3346307 RepID=UPI0036D8EE6D